MRVYNIIYREYLEQKEMNLEKLPFITFIDRVRQIRARNGQGVEV